MSRLPARAARRRPPAGNQPLNVIRLTADTARARVVEGKADAAYLDAKLARISEQTARAAAIIAHMRVFGRKPTERPQPFDLGEAVRSAVGFFTETARLEGCRLDLDIASDVTVPQASFTMTFERYAPVPANLALDAVG